MSSLQNNAIFQLARERGILRSRDLAAKGLSRNSLARLVKANQMICLSRGLYVLPDKDLTEQSTLVEVAVKFPQSFFCLLTALQLHGLTTQTPSEVWLAVANYAREPKMDYPPLRVIRATGEVLEYGVDSMLIDGVVTVRVTSIERAIADCFKFRNKVGLDVAIEALQEAWRSKRLSMDELWRCAQVCRVSNVMRPYLESLV